MEKLALGDVGSSIPKDVNPPFTLAWVAANDGVSRTARAWHEAVVLPSRCPARLCDGDILQVTSREWRAQRLKELDDLYETDGISDDLPPSRFGLTDGANRRWRQSGAVDPVIVNPKVRRREDD